MQISRLHVEPDTRAQSLVIRFPAGWSRPVAGAYEASEELVILDGLLTMSGETYGPGDWAFFPAGFVRNGTYAEPSVLAYARFGGPARWHEGLDDNGPPAVRAHLDEDVMEGPSPLGAGRARLLREGVTESAWLVDELPARASAAAEIFGITERAWTMIAAGDAIPAFEGPCFCRIVFAGGSS